MGASILKQWLKLARLQAGAATAITCVFGAILMMPAGEIDYLHLLLLFIIGLLYHFYGFVLNEYSDIEVDRYAKELSDKPLVKGTIGKQSALAAAIVAIISAVILAVIFFGNLYAILALLIAIFFGAIYDLFGKRFFGADIVLGASILFFTLFGAYSVSSKITSAVILVAFLFFIQLSFQTGVTGGMKDIPHDSKANAKTSPVYLGCRVDNKKLFISREFKLYVIGTKALHTYALFLPFFFFIVPFYEPVLIQAFFIVLLTLLMWATSLKVLSIKVFDRLKLMRLLGGQEIVTYPMVSILIMGAIGIWFALFLLFFPIIWLAFFLYIIYGKFMPDV